MNFSDKIKFQREQNHLTQKELAELVGVSQRAIAAYESSGTIARIQSFFVYVINILLLQMETASELGIIQSLK